MSAGVKRLSSAVLYALGEERHFALLVGLRFPLWARFESSGSGTQSDPTISSIPTAIMITCSNSPAWGSGIPNHYAGDLLLTIAISGRSHVRTELLHLTVVAVLTPHPVQMHRQLPRHGYLGDLPSTPHGEVKESAAPFRQTPHRDLRRFH